VWNFCAARGKRDCLAALFPRSVRILLNVQQNFLSLPTCFSQRLRAQKKRANGDARFLAEAE